MFSKVREALRELLRPAYAPVMRLLRRRLGRNYFAHPEMQLPPPYEAVQIETERFLHNYLHVRPDDISQIVIVGAHEAHEINRLLKVYRRASFLCFEPNPATFKRLAEKFAGFPQVRASDKALGKRPGTARFFEMTMAGNGSLLEPDVEEWLRFTQLNKSDVVSFEVTVSTLDKETAGLDKIDLLWMDVQGAEGDVLAGGVEALARTKAVFLEVALVRSAYKGTLLFPGLSDLLRRHGFLCVGLGLDAWSGTGNALFVRQFADLVCKAPDPE
jgi:FkbM family methyltransferase